MRILFLHHHPGRPKYDVAVIEQQLNGYASPGTTVELHFPDDFPGSHNANGTLAHYSGIPALARKIVWAEENGFDAIVQSNGYDPGVEAGRLAVRIPVIGILRTAMHTALNLANKVGVTTVGRTEEQVWTILRAYGVDRFVTGVRALRAAQLEAGSWYQTHSEESKALIYDLQLKAMSELVTETGAELILPLGGVVIPYLVDPVDLERELGVQVLNPKAIGIRFAELCVNLNLTHSAVTYPHVPITMDDFN